MKSGKRTSEKDLAADASQGARLKQKPAEQQDAQDDHYGNYYDLNQGHLG